jgi:phosphatidylglycerol lysyltransferase
MITGKVQRSAQFLKTMLWLEPWGIRLVALLTWLIGVVILLSAVWPAMLEPVTSIPASLPLVVRVDNRLATGLAGLALVLLAGGLWRRKRNAWLLTMLLLSMSAAISLLKGVHIDEAGPAIALVLLLLLLRRNFQVNSDPFSQRLGSIVLLCDCGFILAYGLTGFILSVLHSHHLPAFQDALHPQLFMLFPFFAPAFQPDPATGSYVATSIDVVGITSLGIAIFLLFRPVRLGKPASADERNRAAGIVSAHGSSTTARLALLADKHYFFSPGGSVIAYAVRGRGALALGNPIGPVEDAEAAIADFQALCARNDWQPSFYFIPEESRLYYQAAGFDLLCFEHEAIIPLASFSLEGSHNKALRNAYTKLVRLGYTSVLYCPPFEESLLRELRPVSDNWLSNHRGGEKHFFVGCFDRDYICSCPVMVVRAPDGRVAAFANIISASQKREIAVDLMRRHYGMMNGSMEFLFVSLLQWAKAQDYETVSLGGSTIFGKGSQPGDTRITRVLHLVTGLVSRFYRFEGLQDFKEKFHPRWETRYLVYPGMGSLALILITLARLHSGDDFLWGYLRK